MGKHKRERPARLAEKLLQIRLALGLSQNELLRALRLEEKYGRQAVSDYEAGIREPPLPYLLSIARFSAKVAGIESGKLLEILIDDELKLPAKLLAVEKGRAS